jgi:two-component system KDP operon response regulator KdpE
VTDSPGARVLVVDDELAIQRVVGTNLRRHGFQVEAASTGAEALEAYARQRPDLVLLDLALPDMDGVSIIKVVREHASTPIVVLSARDTERDKVRALDEGADDYLTKPFGVDELLARVRVGLRHAARPARGADAVVHADGLEMDLERRQVLLDGKAVHLTPTEYDLLKTFMLHPNQVLTDRMLLREVWGHDYGAMQHSLHVYVARLRRKLEPNGPQPRRILTEPGVGYRLVMDE